MSSSGAHGFDGRDLSQNSWPHYMTPVGNNNNRQVNTKFDRTVAEAAILADKKSSGSVLIKALRYTRVDNILCTNCRLINPASNQCSVAASGQHNRVPQTVWTPTPAMSRLYYEKGAGGKIWVSMHAPP